MTLPTFEGSWEDMQVHADELIGYRRRVTVLEKLRGKIGKVAGASPNLSETTNEKFSELMLEKHPK